MIQHMGLDPKEPFPKRPRLKNFDYSGMYAYFITILTKNHATYFREAEVVECVINILNGTTKSERFDVLTYCFMPDHLHLLVIGTEDHSNLKKFITHFKQKSGYWFKKNYNRDLWHISYFEHVLRKEENMEDIALYILGNPLRKGLVSDFREYPFSKSFL